MFGKKKIQVDFEKLKYYDEFEKNKSDASIAEELTGKTDHLVLHSVEQPMSEGDLAQAHEGIFAEQFEPEKLEQEPVQTAQPMSLQIPEEDAGVDLTDEPSVLPLSEPLTLPTEEFEAEFSAEPEVASAQVTEEIAPLELSISDAVAQMDLDSTEAEETSLEPSLEEANLREDLVSVETEYPVEAMDEIEAPFETPAPSREALRVEEVEEPTVDLMAVPIEKSEAIPAARRSGRTKTRLLGFEHSNGNIEDIFANKPEDTAKAPVSFQAVGWIVVVSGPGRGHSIPLNCGVSQIGRGDDQSVQLDFGDNSISRSNHASVAYDEEKRQFFVGHGGKSNIVRLNDSPVLSTEEMVDGDRIRIGETTLQLVAFCDEDFSWSDQEEQNELNGAREESSSVSAH